MRVFALSGPRETGAPSDLDFPLSSKLCNNDIPRAEPMAPFRIRDQ